MASRPLCVSSTPEVLGYSWTRIGLRNQIEVSRISTASGRSRLTRAWSHSDRSQWQVKGETMLLIEDSRTPSEAKDAAAQAQTNTALELTSSQDYQGIVPTHSSRLQLNFVR